MMCVDPDSVGKCSIVSDPRPSMEEMLAAMSEEIEERRAGHSVTAFMKVVRLTRRLLQPVSCAAGGQQ